MTYKDSHAQTTSIVAHESKIEDKVPKIRKALKPALPLVDGFSDQNGAKYVRVAEGGETAFAPLDQLTSEPTKFWKLISEGGVTVVTQGKKSGIGKLVEAITDWPATAYVARTPGFHAGAFVKPDGAVIGTPLVEDFRVVLDHLIPLHKAGSLKGCQKLIHKFVRGQPMPITVLCLALAGPILRLSPYPENIGMELSGGSSNGKTTLLNLFASVFGAPLSAEGTIASTWRNTDFTIEHIMRSRAGFAVALDETAHARFSKNSASEVGQAIHLLSSGKDKGRYGTEGQAAVPIVYLSTSNSSLNQLLGVTGHDLDAARVRLITIDVGDSKDGNPAHKLGVWHHLPEGFSDAAKVSSAFAAAMVRNHGWLMDAFLTRLVRELKRDENALRALIARRADRFMKAALPVGAEHTGVEHRVAQKFAVIYAAGKLASDWDVMPLKKLRKPLMACFRSWLGAFGSAVGATEPGAINKVRRYLTENAASIIDLDSNKPPKLSTSKLDQQAGFFKTLGGRRCFLIRSAKWEAQFGAEAFDMTSELKKGGLLVARDGRQAQVRVRRGKAKDRVFAIRI